MKTPMRFILALTAGLALTEGCVLVKKAPARTDALYISHVHRGGGRNERPDNTLETFLWCWQNGSSVECDCRRTKDGVGIMFHDGDMGRTPRGIPAAMAKQKLDTLTWDEIKNVDVGSYLNPKYASERIPTIQAVFAAMKGHPEWLAFVDEKGATPEYIAARAKEAGVTDQVYYTTSQYKDIVRWGKVVPGGKSLLWIGAWPKNHTPAEMERTRKHFEGIMAELRAADFKGVTAVSLHTYYNPKFADPFCPASSFLKTIIAEFHAHGVKVASIPFEGGESEETYFKLWEFGCDAFSSDYPSVMFSVIRQLKQKAK